MRRREILRSCGIALTAASLPLGHAAARGGDSTAAEHGIRTAVKKLLHNGKFDRAYALLDRHGVPYSRTVSSLPVQKSDDGVSTQDTIDHPKDEAGEMDLGVYAMDDDEYYSFLGMDLSPDVQPIDTAGPNDGISISYSDTVFQTLPDTTHTGDFIQKEDTNQYGFEATFDDKAFEENYLYGDGSTTTGMGITMRKRNVGYTSATVYSDFVHTWNPFNVPSCCLSVSLNGPGALSVSWSGSADSWRAEDHTIVDF